MGREVTGKGSHWEGKEEEKYVGREGGSEVSGKRRKGSNWDGNEEGK